MTKIADVFLYKKKNDFKKINMLYRGFKNQRGFFVSPTVSISKNSPKPV